MKLISKITVREIDGMQMGSDAMVVAAARVSTSGEEAQKFATLEATEGNFGLINYLMQHRHGTPFEHGAITFFVHAPIFVWREWHRHRIGFSYNEESGRYKQLDPVFWIPSLSRKIVPIPDPGTHCPKCYDILKKISQGIKYCSICDKEIRYHTSARPLFQSGSEQQHEDLVANLKTSYESAYQAYAANLESGFAKEVSRACLPVGIYSSCWVTCNPRSLMAFLSLRTHDPKATYVSYPQAEIEEAARMVENSFQRHWPLVHKAFIQNGRVGA